MASSINIVIQDVVYDPVGRDVEGEYVVIANLGPDPVDMSGWTLQDTPQHRQRAPYTFKFPRFILAPGSLVRVHTGSGINDADDLYWGRGAAAWTNTGDTAVLSDERGRKISRFTFAVQTVPAQPFLGTVVISDIHIGDNSRTCWYQKTVHEQYLLALMDWIIERATEKDPAIDRLIILGIFLISGPIPPIDALQPPSRFWMLIPKSLGPTAKCAK